MISLRAVSLALSAMLLAGCGRGEAAPPKLDVAVLLSGGGRGDRGFNDAAITGATRAAKEFGVAVRFVDPSIEGEAATARAAARDGARLVIGVGFQFSEPLQVAAPEYPAVSFIGVDMERSAAANGATRSLPDNVGGIAFREDEGAFLVGALAAMKSRTRTVGFVGGMRSEVMTRFEDGYRSGARYVCPGCRVLVSYVGTTPDAFASPAQGGFLADSQFTAGADVVFHAAGLSGNGVIDAAARAGKLAIGADTDQSSRAPGHVLTSMQKSVDVAVYEAIKLAHLGRLRTGSITTLGLAQDGVGYVYNAGNQSLITPEMHARAEQLREDIVAGRMATRAMPAAMPTM